MALSTMLRSPTVLSSRKMTPTATVIARASCQVSLKAPLAAPTPHRVKTKKKFSPIPGARAMG